MLFNQLPFIKASMIRADGACNVICKFGRQYEKEHTFKFTNLQEVSLFDLDFCLHMTTLSGAQDYLR